MAAINVDKLSLKELVALQEKLASAITEARSREKAEVKRKLTELATEHGFSVGELFGARSAKAKVPSTAKYANPDDPTDTWSGRGRRPGWLVARLKKGAKPSDFAI